jgi:large subunit ribosomal protein L6e
LVWGVPGKNGRTTDPLIPASSSHKQKFTFKYQGAGPAKGVVGKYYPADDVVPKKGPTPVRNAPKLKKPLVAGQVVILVAGRFAGKRVVYLKQLASGLLLVTGPYNVNGVPLRRVNQKYIIATSTKVSVAGVDASKIDDKFFAREKAAKGADATTKTKTSPARQAAQTAVDTALKANIAKEEMLESYLKSKFSLKTGERPHALKF